MPRRSCLAPAGTVAVSKVDKSCREEQLHQLFRLVISISRGFPEPLAEVTRDNQREWGYSHCVCPPMISMSRGFPEAYHFEASAMPLPLDKHITASVLLSQTFERHSFNLEADVHLQELLSTQVGLPGRGVYTQGPRHPCD
jgi:hypothetical protein